MADNLKRSFKSLLDSVKNLEANSKALAAEQKALVKRITGHEQPLVSFTNLEKSYLNAVKQNGGLATAKPSTLKAIKAAEKSANGATIKAAVAALKAEVAELGKANQKDPNFKKYEKAAGELMAKLSSLEKI